MTVRTILDKIYNYINSDKTGKRRFVSIFFGVVLFLALIKCLFPGVDGNRDDVAMAQAMQDSLEIRDRERDAERQVDNRYEDKTDVSSDDKDKERVPVSVKSVFFNDDGTERRTRIYSVSSFQNTFNDLQEVQLQAARKYGVSPVTNRADADRRKDELVNIECSPYFHVDRLSSSIAYLVPRAAVLLNDIGRSYFDSLQIKGIPLHKVIVTSVLRTKEDVVKLRTHNVNATENSCHLYGTTFDLCYNRYITVDDPDSPGRRAVRNDSLKWVLSEVLRDLQKQRRCYVKYEVKQGCFHITVN